METSVVNHKDIKINQEQNQETKRSQHQLSKILKVSEAIPILLILHKLKDDQILAVLKSGKAVKVTFMEGNKSLTN